MIFALDARLANGFTQGLLAAVNPCGFVLLPTYLLYFLGMENLRPGAERTSISRALAVSLSVSGGFMSVFIVIGVITKWSTRWFMDKAPYLSLVMGLGLVVLGIAMLFGYRLPFTTPKLDIGKRDRSVRSMYVFGIAYAIASLGCTLPGFISVVLGGVTARGGGILTGVAGVALYGVGMALLVSGLTITLAVANTALLRVLRKGMEWFEYIAGVFVLLTGMYLAYYWYTGIKDDTGTPGVISGAESWQTSLSSFIRRNQSPIVVLSSLVIAAAIGFAILNKRRHHTA